MSTTASTTPKRNTFPLLVLGAAAALLVGVVAAQQHALLGLSDRAAFLILTAIGFTMCAFSPLSAGATYGWANPRHIAGYLLGSFALLLSLAVLFNASLPAGLSHLKAIYLLAGVMALKAVIGASYTHARA